MLKRVLDKQRVLETAQLICEPRCYGNMRRPHITGGVFDPSTVLAKKKTFIV
jgi:hypothetical protein